MHIKFLFQVLLESGEKGQNETYLLINLCTICQLKLGINRYFVTELFSTQLNQW